MARIGDTIKPELARINPAPLERAGQATGAALAGGLTRLGQGAGDLLARRKEDKKTVAEGKALLSAFEKSTSDPRLESLAKQLQEEIQDEEANPLSVRAGKARAAGQILGVVDAERDQRLSEMLAGHGMQMDAERLGIARDNTASLVRARAAGVSQGQQSIDMDTDRALGRAAATQYMADALHSGKTPDHLSTESIAPYVEGLGDAGRAAFIEGAAGGAMQMDAQRGADAGLAAITKLYGGDMLQAARDLMPDGLSAAGEAAFMRAVSPVVLGQAAEAQKPIELDAGQKKLLENQGAKVGEWLSGGRERTAGHIRSLEEAKRKVDEIGTGVIKGKFTPGFIRDAFFPEMQDLQEQVRGVGYQSLKDTLGAQFTEKEGEKYLSTWFNAKYPEDINKRKLDQRIGELQDYKDRMDELSTALQLGGEDPGAFPEEGGRPGAAQPGARMDNADFMNWLASQPVPAPEDAPLPEKFPGEAAADAALAPPLTLPPKP